MIKQEKLSLTILNLLVFVAILAIFRSCLHVTGGFMKYRGIPRYRGISLTAFLIPRIPDVN